MPRRTLGGGPDLVVPVDKEEGISSYDVIRRVKPVLRGMGVLKIGHAGTLDPFASGLLLVLVGEGTKLSRFLMGREKGYVGTLRLGAETDTLDPCGRVVAEAEVPDLDLEEVRFRALPLLGEIDQKPPAYSALHSGGVRAYALARRGEEVTLQMRRVRVVALEILSVVLPEIRFEVRCSAGTYVRTLAADLARRLGSVGHLTSLRRLSIGDFDLTGAVPSGDLGKEGSREALLHRGVRPGVALSHMPSVEIEACDAKRIRQGRCPSPGELGLDRVWPGSWEGMKGTGGDQGYVRLLQGEELVAVARVIRRGDEGGGPLMALTLERVFLAEKRESSRQEV